MMRGFTANFANVPALAKPSDPYGNYEFRSALPQLITLSYGVLIVYVLCLVVYFKQWWRTPWLRNILCLSAAYLIILLLFNYKGYLSIGKAYSIQPRYLLPLMIPIMVSVVEVIKFAIKSMHLRATLALLVCLIYIYSGGAFGWFIRANDNWYWPSGTVINTNQSVQKVIHKIIIN